MRPSFAEINLSSLEFNYLNIRKKVNRKIMAVVKADAYGHGVKRIVKKLDSLGDKQPDYYAVAIPEEGIELRKLKVKQPILIFEPISPQQAKLVFKYNLIPTVSSPLHLKIFEQTGKIEKPLRVHVKIDTGMNRIGVAYSDAFNFLINLSRDKNFITDGIYTHFATSDEKDKTFANLQLERFKNIIQQLKEAGVDYGLAHAANSGAILDMPEAYFDMVRPGISLYGYYPSLETSESIKLKPVMSLISFVNSVKRILPGESVSYGRKFTAENETTIIEVPFGYADGYRRNLTNKTFCLVKGKMYPQVGTITMDRVMFNAGNDIIKIGQKVILLGKTKTEKIDAWDWGNVLGTIPYEVTCGITKRVPRVYKD